MKKIFVIIFLVANSISFFVYGQADFDCNQNPVELMGDQTWDCTGNMTLELEDGGILIL